MTSNMSSSGKQRFWGEHIAKWSTTELSQVEYCRRNKISLKIFQYYKKKTERNSSALGLVEVPLLKALSIPTLTARPQLCLIVNDRYRIEISKGFDSEDLERVVRLLGRI